MRAVFISYRRDDSEGQAGRIFDDLREQLGAGAVFMDVAGIEPGRDFRRAIDQQVASCGVLLAVIGKSWLTVKNEGGQRRLDDPKDFVRLETAAALKRDIPVVPVLVQGATMPRAEDLPKDLRDLAFRHAFQLTHVHWDSDIQVLAKALRSHLDVPETASPAAVATAAAPSQPSRRSRRPLIAALVGILVLAVIGIAGYVGNLDATEEDSASEDESPTSDPSMTTEDAAVSLVGRWSGTDGTDSCVFVKDDGRDIEGQCDDVSVSGSYEDGNLAKLVMTPTNEENCVGRGMGELSILSDEEIELRTEEWDACGTHYDPATIRLERLAQ